jgi:hypothetical protein
MSEKVQLKGGICEFDFGYNAKMDGYTTLMSDIPKLYAIAPPLVGIKYTVKATAIRGG